MIQEANMIIESVVFIAIFAAVMILIGFFGRDKNGGDPA